MAENEQNKIKLAQHQELELVKKKRSMINQIKVVHMEAKKKLEKAIVNYRSIFSIYTDQTKLYEMQVSYINVTSGQRDLSENVGAFFMFTEIDQERSFLEALDKEFTKKLDCTDALFRKSMGHLQAYLNSTIATMEEVMEATNLQDMKSIEIPTPYCLQDAPSTELHLLIEEWQQMDLIHNYSLVLSEIQRLVSSF